MELVMFVGIPASGKSTWSVSYREQGYLVLSSDEIRAELMKGADPADLSDKERSQINSRVFETIRRMAAGALKNGQSVVVDATNLSRKRRMTFLDQIKRIPCRKRCILFIVPPDICKERNRGRTGVARVSEDGMHQMLCRFECPNYWEGWDEIVPAAAPVPYQFPFDAIRGLDQDNPHHSLTLDEHMHAAVQLCRQQGYGEMLERVAAFHNIAKLYTRKYCNMRGEPTSDAHYLGHDNYGAYLYLTQMCCGKELAPQAFSRILYETNLINCHMRPMTCWHWTPAAFEKDRQLFGEEFISDLLALHQADRAAH
ncbi:MAG: ATP-binding protein [Clostridia bacterium]|nr:ATP-binding protein [Clostridia bacterium]